LTLRAQLVRPPALERDRREPRVVKRSVDFQPKIVRVGELGTRVERIRIEIGRGQREPSTICSILGRTVHSQGMMNRGIARGKVDRRREVQSTKPRLRLEDVALLVTDEGSTPSRRDARCLAYTPCDSSHDRGSAG
jgi:hypothetical protein